MDDGRQIWGQILEALAYLSIVLFGGPKCGEVWASLGAKCMYDLEVITKLLSAIYNMSRVTENKRLLL